jgi:hypothetical protein
MINNSFSCFHFNKLSIFLLQFYISFMFYLKATFWNFTFIFLWFLASNIFLLNLWVNHFSNIIKNLIDFKIHFSTDFMITNIVLSSQIPSLFFRYYTICLMFFWFNYIIFDRLNLFLLIRKINFICYEYNFGWLCDSLLNTLHPFFYKNIIKLITYIIKWLSISYRIY